MILVDSSVWVDYFNGRLTLETDYLDRILGDEVVLVGDIMLSEVLQGFRLDEDFEAARRALSRFQQVSLLGPELAVQSAHHYRRLRRQGITIRKIVDCWIATYCIQADCPLLHNDHDFDPFERHLGMPVVHP